MNPLRVEQGYVALPTAPGLGIDLREDVIARHAYREFRRQFAPNERRAHDDDVDRISRITYVT